MPRGRTETSQYYDRPRASEAWAEERKDAVKELPIYGLQKGAQNATLQKLCDYVVGASQQLLGRLSNQGNLLIATLSDSEKRKKIVSQLLWGRKGLLEYEKQRAVTTNALLHARADIGNFNI